MLADYADQNDHDAFRSDPIFKVIAGRGPSDPKQDLASQPTLSPFENDVSIADLNRLRELFVTLFIESFSELLGGVPPQRITLDLDAWDDETHGQQQLTLFHGHYDQHQYYPLSIIWAENDQLVMVSLRHGTATAFLGADNDLRYIVERVRAVWPNIEIHTRADSGFGVPLMLALCEERRLLLVGYSPSESSGASPLPGVAAECRRIAASWPKPVTTLLDHKTSASLVTRQFPIHQIVHLATHGFVDEQANNIFGGLLLAPDADGNDSLSYLDILRTDLTGCELAVLSACQTSVGPERPMEASTSLAQAFLAAGARQVVASLWHVSEESTAELMTDFYKRLAEDAAAGQPLRVAESLHAAKRLSPTIGRLELPRTLGQLCVRRPSKVIAKLEVGIETASRVGIASQLTKIAGGYGASR